MAGYQRWRQLLFMHWELPVEAVRAVVPPRLELDLWDGRALVGVVPFLMEGVRPWRWWPERLSFAFPETNVRTYVRCGDRSGVFFLSLEAASRLAVWGARTWWGLPYYFASMTVQRRGDEIDYHTRRAIGGVTHQVRYRIGQPLGPSNPGSVEHFLLERYLLYVERRGRLFEGDVAHVPYPAHAAEVLEVADGLVAATGLPGVSGLPRYAHFSPGVDVKIGGLRDVDVG